MTCRESKGCLVPDEAATQARLALGWHPEFRQQFGFGVRPVNRCGMFIQLSTIGLQMPLQGDSARKGIGGKHVAWRLTENEFDLGEPARILGQPGEPHLTGQLQRGEPGPELRGGMRGPLSRIRGRTFPPAHRVL